MPQLTSKPLAESKLEVDDLNRFGMAKLLVESVAELLSLAGEPVTSKTLGRFIEQLPRSSSDLNGSHWLNSYCYVCCHKAYEGNHTNDIRARVDDLVEYLFYAFVVQPSLIQEKLRDCVLGERKE